MIDQYKKETSQIHAPADLILKTKQAVREEEERLRETSSAQEMPENPTKGQAETVESQEKPKNYGKIYRIALPVAAAALFVVLLGAVPMVIGNRNKSYSGAAMEEMTATTEEPEEISEMEAEADAAEDAMAEEGAEYGEAEAAEAAEDSTEIYGNDMGGVMSEAEVAHQFGAETATDSAAAQTQNAAEDSLTASGETAGLTLSVTEVEKAPSFYEDPHTECIVSHDLEFYVARERGKKWSAYVRVGGSGYVISGSGGEAEDREAFVEMAYEELTRTVEGIE